MLNMRVIAYSELEVGGLMQQQRQHVFEKLADFILEHRDEIIEKWIKALQDESLLNSSSNLTHENLVDHMPNIFKELATFLRQQPEHFDLPTARIHGHYRWQQGYRLDKLLRELGLFSIVLVEYFATFLQQLPEIT